MTTKLRLPAGYVCRALDRLTNPRWTITRWPFGLLVRLRFIVARDGGGCIVLLDREKNRQRKGAKESRKGRKVPTALTFYEHAGKKP